MRNFGYAFVATFCILLMPLFGHSEEAVTIASAPWAKMAAPIQFPLSICTSPITFQARLDEISRTVKAYCDKYPSARKDNPDLDIACYLPQLVAELDKVGTSLSAESFDAGKLNITLTGRMHPLDFFTEFSGKVATFDARYARFLMAKRLIWEIWPAVITAKFTRGWDYWIPAWLNSNSPWSMFWVMADSVNCANDCALKKEIGETLFFPAKKIQGDLEMRNDIEAVISDSGKFVEDLGNRGVHLGLLKGLSNTGTGGLMINKLIAGQITIDPEELKQYLAHVETDSLIPLPANFKASANVCDNLKAVVSTLPESANADLRQLPHEVRCAPLGADEMRNVDESFRDALEERKMTWRFNNYLLRLTISTLFHAMRPVPPQSLQAVQKYILLQDVEQARRRILEVKAFADGNVPANPAMAWLYKMHRASVAELRSEISK